MSLHNFTHIAQGDNLDNLSKILITGSLAIILAYVISDAIWIFFRVTMWGMAARVLYRHICGLANNSRDDFFTYRETSSGGKAKISTWKKFLLFFSLIMFFEGHGLHAAANTINIMISTDVPQKGLINFLDEILSHKLIYTAFFLMLIGGVLVESKKTTKPRERRMPQSLYNWAPVRNGMCGYSC